ncbi:MAG TPA: DNA-directed RNA polymerase subunit omega [Terriglobales bacterium]|jgi:hypothetical protein|nr:DNA-directed RNA polymerase subunit omega [Terriglobales bacterium]
MRSELIYDALRTVQNRYLLCQVASKATRKFHRPNTRIQDTMNEVLERFAESESPTRIVAQPELLAEARRRAA